jgi:lysozyme family protein
MDNKERLVKLSKGLNLPWTLMAALVERESSGSMNAHPSNGDPLTARTTHDPKGLPTESEPPYTFESVAEEEYREIVRPHSGVWNITRMMQAAERFNGTGYWAHERRSPYIVASTTLQTHGKYTGDHSFDDTWWDEQVGCLALWLTMIEHGEALP